MRAMFPSRLRCFLDGPGRPWLAFCLLGLASVIFMCAEMHNGRFACRDFEVYYKAGARVAAGENLYRPEEDGFYEYLYSPVAAIYFAPIWAASIFIKPLALIFVPYFILKRRYRELAWFAAFVTMLFFSPMLFYERTDFWGQYRSQVRTFETEFNQKAAVATPGNHTVFSVLVRHSPLSLLSWTSDRVVALHGVVLALVGVAVLWLIKRGRHLPDGHVLEFAALIALTPLLSSTAYSAFGFVQLAVFLLLFNFHRLGPRARLWTAGGCVLTGGNWYDLWGRRLWHAFDDSSLITIGTLTLCGALWMARRKQVL